MERYSRETEDLQGVPVVYGIQSHSQLEYAEIFLIITQKVDERSIDVLCKDENPKVDIHLPGCRCCVATHADTGLVKAHEQFALDRQVDNGLNDHGEYVEPAVY